MSNQPEITGGQVATAFLQAATIIASGYVFSICEYPILAYVAWVLGGVRLLTAIAGVFILATETKENGR